jgi:enoyl-CoA hydratase/carnithine racemase
MTERVVYYREEGIQYIELVSPPQNPVDQLFFEEMAAIIPILYERVDCLGVIVRGQGCNFSYGADIEELVEAFSEERLLTVEQAGFRSLGVFEALARYPKPVVAAIQGYCLGSGLEFALACHYRIADSSGLFGLPEVCHGLLPGCGATYRLPRIIGPAKSMEMILTGRNISAKEALALQLVDLVVTKDMLMNTATKIIRWCCGDFVGK